MILSYNELIKLVDLGVINADKSQVKGSSIDITLGDSVYIEKPTVHMSSVDLAKGQSIATERQDIREKGFKLYPKQFILASSVEVFNLPNDITATYSLKSSMARNGLEHLMAGHCDPTWSNSNLTLELYNTTANHVLILTKGMPIGQMHFFRHEPVPDEQCYINQGQYNYSIGVVPSRGIK